MTDSTTPPYATESRERRTSKAQSGTAGRGPAADGRDRREPGFAQAGAYQGYSRAEASPDEGGRGWFSRFVLVLMIFAVGAVAGLGGAWWLGWHKRQPMKIVLKPPAAAPAQTAAPTLRAPVSARAGIPASELPYDGKPPPADAARAAAPRATPSSGASPARAAASPSAPVSPATSGNASASQSASSAPAAMTRSTSASGKSESTGREANSATKPSVAPPAAEQERKAAASAARKEEPVQVRQAEPVKKTVPVRERSRRKPAQDHEIERMREQAAQELKKKTEARAEKSSRERDEDERAGGSKRIALERCERVPSLIGREMCKWKACNGMWGKNGCPSFDKPVSTF